MLQIYKLFFNHKNILKKKNVKNIKNEAFVNCLNLKEINFGKNLNEIGSKVFYSSGIKNIKIDNSNLKPEEVAKIIKGKFNL